MKKAIGPASPALRKRLKLAGVLLASGLGVEALTMQWAHPTAFITFLILGGLLIGTGIGVYLWSLISD